jgi:hypothetical protein
MATAKEIAASPARGEAAQETTLPADHTTLRRCLAVVRKSSTEEIRASIVDHCPTPYLDVRAFKVYQGGRSYPTPRGFTIPLEHLPELLAALEALSAFAATTKIVRT